MARDLITMVLLFFALGTAPVGGTPSGNYDAVILVDGPVIYYKHEEASGTVVTDFSGNAFNGVYPGSGITYGASGPLVDEDGDLAVTLDGAAGKASYLTLATTDRPTYPFCLEAWIKPDSAGAADVVVQLRSAAGDDGAGMDVHSSGTVWGMDTFNVGQNDVINSSTVPLVDGAYQHLFARFVSSTERYLYQNGEEIAGSASETTVTWSGTESANYEFFVGINGAGSDFMPGAVSRTAYYNADVSPQRIAEHFNAGIPYYGIEGTLEYTPLIDGDIAYGPMFDGTLEYRPPGGRV